MTDSYIRRFSPNKWHFISVLCAVISVVLLVSGAYRAFRVMGSIDPTGMTSEGNVHENDSILTSLAPVRVKLEEANNDRIFSCGTIGGGLTGNDIEIVVVDALGKYRYAAVEHNTEEYEKLLGGEKVTGYFSRKYGDDFLSQITSMGKKLSQDTVISADDCADLGLIIVDREKELLSFLWFFPFLALALILFKIGGSPYFYYPENDNQHSGG